ncbi:unnamed protein product, partial [Rhizoctonia solani]
MPRSARDYVNSLANSLANSDTRLNTAKSTANDGHVGLYDFPPNDPRSREHVTGRRPSRSTERNALYRATRDREERRRRRSNDTQASNASSLRVRVQEPTSQQEDPAEAPQAAQRGRSRAIRPLSRSPSPGSTDYEQEQPTQAPGGSQYTYKYETLDHEGLIHCAQEEFDLDVRGCDTQTIINRIRLAGAEPPSQVGSARSSASKRSSDAVEVSEGSSKRQHREFVVDDDTATESKTDNDIDFRPHQSGAPAPPHLHEAAPATILDTPSSNASSHSLGGSLARSPFRLLSPWQDQPLMEVQPLSKEPKKTKLPRLIVPVSGPVHARLRNKLIDSGLDEIGRSLAQQLDTHNQTNELQASDLDEVLETGSNSPTNTPQPAAQQYASNPCTYHGHRSDIQTKPEATAAKPTSAEDIAEPDSPRLTPSQLIQRARAQAIAAKVQEEMAEIAPRRRPLLATGSRPPTSLALSLARLC